MTLDQIREALHRQPFQPFVIRLTDGTQRLVPHPDFIAVARRRAVVLDARTGAMSIIDPPHIVSIEYADQSGRFPDTGAPGDGNER